MKKQLHPGAKWLFRIKGFFGSLAFLWVIGWVLFFPLSMIFKGIAMNNIETIFAMGFGAILFYLIAVIIVAEIYARMAYNRWFYEFTSDNLKIERGIIWKRYSNVPYERVQNVDITRGIIARLCGFSSVNIQTAGYSYTGRGMPSSEGHIPAVNPEEAEQIRDFLIRKISKKGSKSGL